MNVPFPLRPGLTAWLGLALLLGAASSALAWADGRVSLGVHLLTSLPMFYFLFICIHDGVHGVLHRVPVVSDLIAGVLSTGVGLPFPLLRRAHLTHHNTLGDPRDPEHVVYSASLPALLFRLPVVPIYYLREAQHLGRGERLWLGLHLVGWLSAVAVVGTPLVVGWLLPVLLAVVWFGFTTVYVPHCAHQATLMRYFNLHSGYHHDHHRMPWYPFHQYFRLRLDGLQHHGSVPTFRHEAAWLRLATWEPWSRGTSPENGSPSGS